jgi:hypothetical protein
MTYESDITRSKRHLDAAIERKDWFAANFHHDLYTRLNDLKTTFHQRREQFNQDLQFKSQQLEEKISFDTEEIRLFGEILTKNQIT